MCIHTHRDTYTHTKKYYSAIKEKEIMPFAAMWMDLESIMLRQILYDITYMWNLKNNTNEYINICKTETDSQI